MSLIQEALKRQQQEMGTLPEDTPVPTQQPGAASPAEAAPITQPAISTTPEANVPETKKPEPPLHKKPMTLASKTPPPPPAHAIEPESPDTKKSEGAPWKKLIIFVVFLFLIIAAAAWMVIFALKNMAEEQPEEIATDTQPEAVTKIEPKEKTNSFLEKIIKKTEHVAEPKEHTTEQPTTKVAKKEGTVPVATLVKWPQLKLMGALAKGGAGQAMINGEFVTVGGEIEGVKLVRIKGNKIELSYKNETRVLKVGDTTQ